MNESLIPAASTDPKWAVTWQELGQGAPTLAGLAHVAGVAIATGGDSRIALSREARCLLFAARNRGIFEIKGANRAFDAPGRMLAVYVETDVETTLIFRFRENPTSTIRFLSAFRELCAAGLIMHHIFTEFSLTAAGLDLSQQIPEEEVASLLAQARSLQSFE